MTAATVSSVHAPVYLDFKLVLNASAVFGGLCLVLSPFTPDTVPFAVGAMVPFACLRILYTPTMPAAMLYLFIWQWLEIFARVLQAWVDGQSMSAGTGGPNVTNAYWYMMASLIVLAIVFRLVMTNMKPPTPAQRTAHFRWATREVVMFYVVTFVVSTMAAVLGRGGLAQPMEALARVKIVGLFTLFVYGMSTGRGTKIMLAVVLFEIGTGFTGFLSDFRGVFVFLGIAAIAARIRWKFTTGLLLAAGLVALTTLALFWTAVKTDYREYASQSSDSQAIVMPLSDRMAYLGNKVLTFGDTDFGETSYKLLARFAYVDIFASVIDVRALSPEPIFMRQWKEAFEHVFQPRFLYPDKPELSDSDVYMRLTQRYLVDEVSQGTSISVGYMGENYADLGFPGMLVGIAFLGLILATCLRILMSFNLPLVMREGIAMAFAFTMARDGVEVSLPKILGAALMFMIVFLTVVRFAAPKIVRWLDSSGAAARAKAG
ncbi:hypothetical protein SAMN02745126_05910 [Enhydrobacter aerosaccus]|uniref:O-antigen polysaccharide polymerase Wzy n=1 Tax=Enhydrobacter aerosaccus TaxID=225324 RepID=A0A1T4TA05_9HYPH|nr:hypothetical protein [Enhydrobacter aerosaccus]SKA37217.1 hypothetical protein SAMN02745126_05910 [Enhydrobacter aerosaccus]